MSYGGIFDYDAKYERLRTVNASLEDPSVWNDPKKAQELGKEKKSLDGVVVTLERLTRELRGRGWRVCDSQTNFLFARPPDGKAKRVFDALKAASFNLATATNSGDCCAPSRLRRSARRLASTCVKSEASKTRWPCKRPMTVADHSIPNQAAQVRRRRSSSRICCKASSPRSTKRNGRSSS